MAPSSNPKAIRVNKASWIIGAIENRVEYSREPNSQNKPNKPIKKAQSPTLLTKMACRADLVACTRVNQKLMSK